MFQPLTQFHRKAPSRSFKNRLTIELCMETLHQHLTFRRHKKFMVEMLHHITREPLHNCQNIYRHWLSHNARAKFLWRRLSSCPDAVFSEHVRQTRLPNQDTLVTYLETCNTGLIITMIHMGDYLSALYRLGELVTSKRSVFIIRNRQWSKLEEDLFSRYRSKTISVQVIRHGHSSAREAIKQLRLGNTLIIFHDLSHQWGSTTPVQLLGQNLHLVKGPAELSLLSKSPILPVSCHYDDRMTPVAEVQPIIQPPLHQRDTRQVVANGLTQRLADLATAQIMTHPCQWQHWLLIPDMLKPHD